jgi:hypothetical protein
VPNVYDWAPILVIAARRWEPDASAVLGLPKQRLGSVAATAKHVIYDFAERRGEWVDETEEGRWIEAELASRSPVAAGELARAAAFWTSARPYEDASRLWMMLLRPHLFPSYEAADPPPIRPGLLESARAAASRARLSEKPELLEDEVSLVEVEPFDRPGSGDMHVLFHLRQSALLMPIILRGSTPPGRARLLAWAREHPWFQRTLRPLPGFAPPWIQS